MSASGKGKFPFKTAWASLGSQLLYQRINFGDLDDARTVAFNDYFFGSTGTVTYTLTAQGGSYTLNGANASLNRNRNLSVQGGSYSITGSSANILRHRNLTASGGSYTYTGQSANITYVAGTTVYTLIAQGGSYALTGSSSTILKHRNLTASGGSYTYTGQTVTISRHRNLTASGGVYNYTGQNATILRNRTLTAQGGTYTLNGQTVNITWSMAGGAVWPTPSQVLFGITYGPTGTEYTGTLDVLGIKYDLSTGQLVKPINDKVVITL